MPERETRKLAAVMFTDIAGYTAMVQADETSALQKVSKYRSVLQTNTDARGGSVISFYGDGSLSIYDSAMEAVRCALAMQEAYRNDLKIPVRIGIHLGDIVLKDETVYGDGVNVASRIETQGVPGCILISGKIQREVANHPEIETKYLGAFKLKNVKGKIDIYALTNDGLTVPKTKNAMRPSRKGFVRAAVAILALFLTGYFLENSGLTNFIGPTEVEVREKRVAVLFASTIRQDSLQYIPEMASRLIVDELVDIPNAKVTSYESVLRQVERQSGGQVAQAGLNSEAYPSFSANTGAVNLLDGYILRVGDSLEFRANLRDMIDDGNIIVKFDPQRCHISDPAAAIMKLGSEILGWWASQDDKTLSVPNKEAYRAYLDARSTWRSNDSLAEINLKKSIRLDKDFVDPYFLLMDLYYNNRRNAEALAYIDTVNRRFPNLTPRQRRILEYHTADVRGDRQKAYTLFLDEMQVDPKDLFNNTAAMVMAAQYVNRPDKVVEFFDLIPIDSLDLPNCEYCSTRLRRAAQAYIELGKHRQAERLLSKLPMNGRSDYETAIRVHAAKPDTVAINAVIANAAQSGGIADPGDLMYEAAWRFNLQKQEALARHYANQAIGFHKQLTGTKVKAYLLSDQIDLANKRLTAWRRSSPRNQFIVIYSGLASAKLQAVDSTQARIADLDVIADGFDPGVAKYHQARMLVQLGETQEGIDRLIEARQEGVLFDYHFFANDVELMPIHDNPAFMDILHPPD